MKSRKYPSYDQAMEELRKLGTLKFFGRVGLSAEKCLYDIHLHDGRVYGIFVHITGPDEGLVELMEY